MRRKGRRGEERRGEERRGEGWISNLSSLDRSQKKFLYSRYLRTPALLKGFLSREDVAVVRFTREELSRDRTKLDIVRSR